MRTNVSTTGRRDSSAWPGTAQFGFLVYGLPADQGRIVWREETGSPEETLLLLWTSASALYTSVLGNPCAETRRGIY